MAKLAENVEGDDVAWAARNEHWLARPHKPDGYHRDRSSALAPLVLCGHGVSLRVEKGTLAIRNGFTHYPQVAETFRFFKGDRALPPRIIMLDGSGSLSFDVLTWLSEQGVPLIRIGWQGDVVSVVGSTGAAYLPDRIMWQIETRGDPEKRLAFCCDLITEKLRSSITTLRTSIPDTPARVGAIATAELVIDRLQRRQVRTVMDVLLAEARAASAYFLAWRGLPLRWKGLKQAPVPDAWLTATTRRSFSLRNRTTNRHSTHPVNAMLNYAYAILHSQVQVDAVSSGYDPDRGIMHESRSDSRALVLDLIEPRRPMIDAVILKFVATNAFAAADFIITKDGVCRLSPQLARRAAALSVSKLPQSSTSE